MFASKKARPQADPLDEDMEVRVFRRFITVKCEQIINGVDDVKKKFFKNVRKSLLEVRMFGAPDWQPEKFAWVAEYGSNVGGQSRRGGNRHNAKVDGHITKEGDYGNKRTKLSLSMGKVSHSIWLPLTKDVIQVLSLSRRKKLTVVEAINQIAKESADEDVGARVKQEISTFFTAAQTTDMFLLKRKGLVSLEASTADRSLFSLTFPRPKLRNPRLGITVNDVLYPKMGL